jgi:hypothetical protein
MVVYTCSHSYWEGYGKGTAWTKDFEANLDNIARPCLKKTITSSKNWKPIIYNHLVSVSRASRTSSEYEAVKDVSI